ncbi:hypothetical protein AVEN_31041-1 [Araneus ventricosus]|uniref:DUF4371 domain-containing protein n=1 Tax=Araneus ventricosus TaxID=182803 RepID=A0A4Y2GEH8_ARAVE|nr:hypothetical protein AVEN_31041-1 [Araneus ventricosus]
MNNSRTETQVKSDMATMASFHNKLMNLEARLRAENDARSKDKLPRDLTSGFTSPQHTPRPKLKTLPIGEFGSPGRPSSAGRSRKQFVLPQPTPSMKLSDNGMNETDWKLQEIMKQANILTINAILFQHANSVKHKKSVKDATDLSQSKLKMISTANGDRGLCLDKTTASSSSMTQWNFNEEEKIISAEILYILHAAVNNISFSSFDGISQLFSRMFPKGEEAKGMKLSSHKVAYEISHGLEPYFLAKISKSIQSCSFFTLLFDETLNKSNKKQLDIDVRFWNCELNAIQQSYVGSEMLFHATASDIDSAIMTCMKKANLCIKKLLMLGSDGPNVNKAYSKFLTIA